MNHTLIAENVGFRYEPSVYLFEQVNLSVCSGALTGVVGPNGSGKSTLLRLLCGLLAPSAGHITLDSKPLASLSPMKRAQVLAFLPQEVSPAYPLSVFDVVCLGRYPHLGAWGGLGLHDREHVLRCMRATETHHLRDREFNALSGGERQRVLLASILAQEPGILLLDEPTSALDIHHQMEVFGLLRRLAADGYGIALVTHDLNLAAAFCDHIILMGASQGLVAAGSPAEVLDEALLTRAYGAPIRVGRNPYTGRPLVWAEAAVPPQDASHA